MKARKVLGTAAALLLSGGVVLASGAGGLADGVRALTDFDSIFVRTASGVPVIGLIVNATSGTGQILWGNSQQAGGLIRGQADVSASGSGRVVLFSSAGSPRVFLDGDTGLSTSGGDVAERFPVAGAIEPGSVVVIDPEHAGRLALSRRAYDPRVAGVAAGARDYRPGIILGSQDDGRVPVTLTGTVYCRVSAENGPIRAGDLLTTASLPGHAMRVSDHDAARGAILGKALQGLESGSGLVLVLASLQ
jgi:hypothetical protein